MFDQWVEITIFLDIVAPRTSAIHFLEKMKQTHQFLFLGHVGGIMIGLFDHCSGHMTLLFKTHLVVILCGFYLIQLFMI